MANNSVQGGLTPVRTTIGVLTGIGNEYEILAANGVNTFVGDPLIAQQTCNAADGTPNVVVSGVTTSQLILGPMRAVKPTLTNLTLQYRAASVLTRVLVEDNPHIIFHIKASAALTSAQTWFSGNVVATAGNTTTGQSGYTLDTTTLLSTSAASTPYKIVRIQPAIGGPVLATGNVAEVIIINHTLLQQQVSAAI
jgi:hypothetical protein